MQLAKHFGATVTGVCSGANVALVRSLGADKALDYTKEDVTKTGTTYDLIFDTVGKLPFARCKRLLKQNGTYLAAVIGLTEILQVLRTFVMDGKKVKGGAASEKVEDLLLLKELIEAGAFKTAIDRCYPLEHIAEAHSYVDKGHKKGNVVITVGCSSRT